MCGLASCCGQPLYGLSPVDPGQWLGSRVGTFCSLLSLQDLGLQLCLVQSVCMVCQAICSSAQAGSFHFARKAELVAQMMVRPCGSGAWGGWRALTRTRGSGARAVRAQHLLGTA